MELWSDDKRHTMTTLIDLGCGRATPTFESTSESWTYRLLWIIIVTDYLKEAWKGLNCLGFLPLGAGKHSLISGL